MRVAAAVMVAAVIATSACSDNQPDDNTVEICKSAEDGIINEVLPVLRAAAGTDGQLSDEEVAAAAGQVNQAFTTAADNASQLAEKADNEKLKNGLEEMSVALLLIVNDPSQLKNFQALTANASGTLDQECSRG